MVGNGVFAITLLAFFSERIHGQSFEVPQSPRCRSPGTTTIKIENIIATCQEEIKLAILKEALVILKETTKNIVQNSTVLRTKRDLFTDEEQRIAGCLLQCVYKKVKAVDANGFPTVEGLVKLYAEGITERGYFLATAQAVQQCLFVGYQKRPSVLQSENNGVLMCDLAYRIFDCISDQLAAYCSGT